MRVVTPWLDLPNVPDAWCRRLTACHAGAQTAGAFFPRPRHEITQVHDLALTALARGRVMVIYIDGLGYSLYRRATLPAIKKRFRCRRARTAFPPLTQPCMASMLTGLWPAQHGIWSRRDHHPRGASLLAVPGAVLVEADSPPLSLEKPPVLTLPGPGETVDVAVLKVALPLCRGEAPLLIVHFHGLDDREHDVGDQARLLADKLRELDKAVEQLCAAFHGHVILCADHGAHRSGKGGEHGSFTRHDMYVPLGEADV